MTSAIFLQSIGAFLFFGSAMLQKLRALSPDLSDSEREQTIRQLEPIHEKLRKNREEHLLLLREQADLVQVAKHDFAPQIHSAVEEVDRDSCLQSLSERMAL